MLLNWQGDSVCVYCLKGTQCTHMPNLRLIQSISLLQFRFMLSVCVARYNCSIIINNQLNMLGQPFSTLPINYQVAVMIPQYLPT